MYLSGVLGSGLGHQVDVLLSGAGHLALLAVLKGDSLVTDHPSFVLRSSYLPSGGSQLSVATALGSNSEVILQASTDDTGGDREVLVVAVYISSASHSDICQQPCWPN